MEAIVRDEDPDIDQLLEPLRTSPRYARVMSGRWPGFPPSDLELSLIPDRFEFAMPVTRQDGYLQVTGAPIRK
jgi:hypothetical protein